MVNDRKQEEEEEKRFFVCFGFAFPCGAIHAISKKIWTFPL